jgi:hypothetical protein
MSAKSSDTGALGEASSADFPTWTEWCTASCDATAALYCFQQ